MKFIKGSPCYCGSSNRIEDCCINFDSPVPHRKQVRNRQKYRYLKDDQTLNMKALLYSGYYELSDYDLSKEIESIIDEYNEINKIYYQLENFFNIVEEEYYEISMYENEAKIAKHFTGDKVNKLVIDYVSNFRLTINYFDNKVKKVFSEKQNEWKRIENFYFENYFSYRLIYHLRNYVQHVGIPIDNVSRKLVNYNGVEELLIEFNMDRRELLKDGLHKEVKSTLIELYDGQDYISIMPLIHESSKILHNLYSIFNKYFFDKYFTDLNRISQALYKNNLRGNLKKLVVTKDYLISGNMDGVEEYDLVSYEKVVIFKNKVKKIIESYNSEL